MAAAREQIQRAPDRKEESYTTSHVFKEQLAKRFCGQGSSMTVLELGVHMGHTTAVLAAIFRKVISVDILRTSLDVAAKHTAALPNVFLLSLDLMAADWRAFASNNVSVVVIDASHDYASVLSDARNSLHYLPDLRYLVFDDYGFDPVYLAVQELEDVGLLTNCHSLGTGWDSRVARSEGRICKADPQRRSLRWTLQHSFLNLRFLLYRLPVKLQHFGYMRFLPDGSILSSQWRTGNWSFLMGEDKYLQLRIPRLGRERVLLHFNERRKGFLMCRLSMEDAEWFGISEDLVHDPFKLANQGFHSY
ncbi:unnamed protein product [Symbiodinium necroappetens]|uniref:Methyltransferase domain-containing protein n=1 Tax=Symbiodinium necroappetens TaxID=1628268 RepID=A0A812NQH8_9DINO|nr:unnamed protein product [Symbiodinium necroappetens]